MSSVAGGGQRAFPVVVLSGGGLQGLTLVRAAAAVAGVRVVVADSLADPLTAPLADEVVRVPPVATESAFVEEVAGIFARLGPGLLLPATEYELPALARHGVRLEAAGARVGAAPEAVLALYGDRARLAAELAAAGIAVAPRLTGAELASAPLPLLAKPRWAGWGGRGQVCIVDEAGRAGFLARADVDAYVIAPLLAGFREFSVDFAIGFGGELSALVARERLRTTGGFCVVAASSEDAVLLETAARVAARVAAAGGRGIHSLQLLEVGDGPFVSDLNLRSGTSGALALERGVNLVEFLVRSARGEPLPRTAPAARRRQWRLLEERSRPTVAIGAEGVVFDLDDTLLDHKLWVLGKLERVAERFAGRLGDPDAFVVAAWTAFEEGERSRTLDVALARLGLEGELREPLIAAYREAVPAASPLYPDVCGALSALRDAGLRLLLVTDNPPASQRQKLAATGLADWFEEVIFTREAGGEKPSPAGIAAALARGGLEPRSAVLVGDSPLRDGQAALAAGLAHFFWLQREGAVFAVHPAVVARRLPDLEARTTRIRSLRELVAAVVRA